MISEHLGDAYLRANLKSKALKKYEEAVRLMNDSKADPSEIEKVERKISELKQKISASG